MVREVTNRFSPAAKAGVRVGDVILRIDDRSVRDTGHLMRLIGGALAGSTVTLDVIRDDREIELPVLLGTRPTQF